MKRRNSVVTLTPLPKEAFSPNHILDSDLVSFYQYDEFSLHGYAWSLACNLRHFSRAQRRLRVVAL